MSFIKINGVEFPSPSYGLQHYGSQLVDSARNANGVVTAATINRRQYKLDNLFWGYLEADVWETMLQEIEKFYGTLEFYSPHHRSWIQISVYWGDDTATPLFADSTGKPKSYVNCACNLIDMGEGITYV